jgi:serine/threonine protein kinase
LGKTHRNSLKPGHKIHWYEIKKILGQGGFGITYLAYDPNLDKNVAIKEYLPIEIAVREGDFSVHPVTEDRSNQYKWGLDRFISEARTLSKFDHPNVVRVLSVTEDNNTAYMVMAYEEGQSLQDKLKGRKTLEEAELLKILIPILGGLEIVHNAGFIHRDIKPDNIFIRNDGSPVLLDFGSARQALGEETKTLTSLVSPGYAPFEQYFSKGDKQGAWTDIYGLGATLYRAIAGIAPQDAVDRSNAIINNSQDTNVSAIDVGRGRYSERFLKAIDHAIKFKPEERPQTINEWKSEFQLPDDPIKQAEEIEQTTTQPGETALARQHKKSLTPVVMIFILAVLVSLFAAFYFEKEVSQYFQSINIISNWQKEKDAVLARQQQEKENQRLLAMEQQRLEQEEALKIAEENKRLDEAALLKQQHIAELFIKAEEAISQDRLVEPVGNNAFDIYMQLSDLSPNNNAVAEGKKIIFKALLRKAEDFMKIDLLEMANRILDQADAIEPDSAEVRLVKVRLKAVQQIALEEKQRLEEEKIQRAIALDKKKLEEEKRLSELEKKRQEEEKRLTEAARLAEQERQQQAEAEVEAEKLQKEQEKKKQFSQLIAKADLALTNRDKDQAIKQYNEALLLYPDDVNANLGLKNAENLKHKLCYEVLGLWVWDKTFGQETIILKENGTIDYQISIKGSGSWECTSPESRTIKIRLSAAGFSNEWLSQYSADGSCLQGPETWGERGCYHRSESDQ